MTKSKATAYLTEWLKQRERVFAEYSRNPPDELAEAITTLMQKLSVAEGGLILLADRSAPDREAMVMTLESDRMGFPIIEGHCDIAEEALKQINGD